MEKEIKELINQVNEKLDETEIFEISYKLRFFKNKNKEKFSEIILNLGIEYFEKIFLIGSRIMDNKKYIDFIKNKKDEEL